MPSVISATTTSGIQVTGDNSGSLQLATNNGTVAMTVDTSQNVLVGTSSTFGNGKLQVAGASAENLSIKTGGNNFFVGFYNSSNAVVGSVSYNGTLTVYSTTSDKRLKENIVNANSGLDKLANVKIRAFDWIDSKQHTDFGVIAQELYKVAPECVTKGDDGEAIEQTWQVDTSALVPAMIKAIQEQQAIITSLTARIEALENK